MNTFSEATLIVEPSAGRVRLNLRELWSYRELLYFLIWRDVKIRYRQAVLGMAWAIVQPVMTMVVFTVVFGRLGRMPSDGVPYPAFAFAALLPWQLFASALNESGNSLVASQNLITKVYFPRLIVPLAGVLGGLVDFCVSFGVLLLILWAYGIVPGAAIMWLPFFVLLALATALGVGLWLSSLNVRYRDVRHTMPFLTQFWLFATPVAYPSSLVPEQWRVFVGFNPMAAVVEGFRWSLLGTGEAPTTLLLTSTLVAVLLVTTGLVYFRRTESTVADFV